MRLFRHYKEKPYKFVGTAVHSETLEEVVIYETLYDNPRGKTWVRPQKMFHESVEINGHPVPRFREIPLRITSTTEIRAEEIQIVSALMEKVFGKEDDQRIRTTLERPTKHYLDLAFIDDQPVGFKMGYALTGDTFYSWLGAVHPEYRNLGIASDLMERQHAWCRGQGYKKIQSKTQNRFQTMLILNIKHGFEIIGTHLSDRGLKIIMEKTL